MFFNVHWRSLPVEKNCSTHLIGSDEKRRDAELSNLSSYIINNYMGVESPSDKPVTWRNSMADR